MPVEFECGKCDKRLRVRDDLAGKRIKCPGCGAAISVPDVDDAPTEREEEQPRPTRIRSERPEPARDDRPTRKRRPDDDEDDRPRRRRDEDDEDDLPRAGRRRDEDDEDDEPRGRRRGGKQKKGGSSLPLILGIGGGVVALGLVGVLTVWMLSGGGGGGGSRAVFVPGDGQGFVSVRLADVWKTDAVRNAVAAARQAQPGMPDPVAEMQEAVGMTPEEIERITVVIQLTGPEQTWVVVETVTPYDQAKVRGKLANPTDGTHEGKKYVVGNLKQSRTAVHFAGPRMLVVGEEPAVRRALEVSIKRNSGPLDEALGLIGSGKHVVAGFTLPPMARAQMQQLARNPQAAQFAPLAEFQSGTVTANVGQSLDIETALRYAADPQAASAKGAADAAVKMATGMITVARFQPQMEPAIKELIDSAEKTLAGLKVEQRGAQMVVKLQLDGIANATSQLGPMLKMVGGGRAPGNVPTDANMKQLLIALHNHHDATGALPTNILDPKTGQPLLSWRVALLPFLEQDALYKQFRLNEPWNSAHNRALLSRMPAIYARPGTPNTGLTPFLRFIGAGTAFPNDHTKMRLTSITDGTSNTIAMVETARPVQWTKPEDLPFTPERPVRNLLFKRNGTFAVGMLDGSVRHVRDTVSDATLRAAITAAGGEVLGDW